MNVWSSGAVVQVVASKARMRVWRGQRRTGHERTGQDWQDKTRQAKTTQDRAGQDGA